MNQMTRQNDATMEDIMSSIRRIVGEDQSKTASRQPAPRLPEPARGFANQPLAAANDYRTQLATRPAARESLYNLTDPVQPVEALDNTRALDPRSSFADIDFVATNKPYQAPADTLLSSQANAAVLASFDNLSKSFAAHTNTLDAMMQEMLQPMLKQWLDDNLPPLVERLIRAEIERVARGGKR